MKDISRTRYNLRLATIGLVLLVVAALLLIVYGVISTRLVDEIDRSDFEQLISSKQDLQEYYQDQKDFQAHFVTAANLIRQDQVRIIFRDVLILIFPIIIIAVIASFILSRLLFKPIQESYDSKQRFLQDAAHELRNPIGAIKASLQALLAEEPANSKFKSELRSILQQAENLNQLSNDLLVLETAEVSSTEKLDLATVIQDVIDQLTSLANERRVKLSYLGPESLEYEADVDNLVTMIRNLISNAIKYSKPNGGSVQIELRESNRRITIKVADDGIGISKRDLEQVGERFYRGSNHETAGTGLGLSIAHKIAQKYGGSIQITSEIDMGTTVYATLSKY